MDQQHRLLIAALLALGVPVFGQNPEPPKQHPTADAPGRPDPRHQLGNRPDTDGKADAGGPRFHRMPPGFDPENARKTLEGLSPEQRKRFQENLKRWNELPAEEKKLLREREEFRNNRIAMEVERAMKELGLDLDKDKREQFAKRYSEERRKLEEQIQKEFEERRKPLIKELMGKLQKEFGAGSKQTPESGAPVPTPAPPAEPGTTP